MKLSTSLSALAALTSTCSAAAAAAAASPPRHLPETPTHHHLFANPPQDAAALRIPTSQESAVLGRRVLALTPLATLSTVFPADADAGAGAAEHRPSRLGGVPIGLMDYIADCEGHGNPTILAIGIATSFKNVAAGSNISVAVSWVPPYPPAERIEAAAGGWSSYLLPGFLSGLLSGHRGGGGGGGGGAAGARYAYSAANLPRFSLLGYLEPISSSSDAEAEALESCFVSTHPDAKYWLPGNRIHASEWVRLVVTQVYWIGGFGDRAYIGWIPVEEWKNVTREEWKGVKLPGEKRGWKEWSVDSWWTSENDL